MRAVDIEKKLVVTSGEREEKQTKGGEWEIQIIRCKISCKNILHNTRNVANILSLTVTSQYCTPVMYVTLCTNYMCTCVCAHVYVCVLVTQSCPSLCDPLHCSPPGSSVHGILHARILEWVAISYSNTNYTLTEKSMTTV